MNNELIEASFHDAPGHLSFEEASAWTDGYNAALAAAEAAGYRLVPVEAVAPTSAQCAAAIGALVRHGLLPKHADTETYLRTYDAMKEALIAAAPDYVADASKMAKEVGRDD